MLASCLPPCQMMYAPLTLPKCLCAGLNVRRSHETLPPHVSQHTLMVVVLLAAQATCQVGKPRQARSAGTTLFAPHWAPRNSGWGTLAYAGRGSTEWTCRRLGTETRCAEHGRPRRTC